MPELPEVEVVRRGLAQNLCGRIVERAEVFHPPTLRGWPVADFCQRLAGWSAESVVRRGKFIWLLGGEPDLPPNGHGLLIHLGMSGQCLVNPPGVVLDNRAQKHLRVRLKYRDGWTLNFIDQRTFGRFTWVPLVACADGKAGGWGSQLPLVPELVEQRIGRDCLDPALDLKAVVQRIRTKRTPIKNVLLDQQIVSGIGNIYADEALFRAGVNPFSEPARLPLKVLAEVYLQAAQVMRLALAQGGTSFDELYVNTQGDPGYFSRSLQVYSRQGQPCLNCETGLIQAKIAGRSATYCPRCQVCSERRARKG